MLLIFYWVVPTNYRRNCLLLQAIKFNFNIVLFISCWKQNPISWGCYTFQRQFTSVYFWCRDILGARQGYTVPRWLWIFCHKLSHIIDTEITTWSVHFFYFEHPKNELLQKAIAKNSMKNLYLDHWIHISILTIIFFEI